MASSRSRNCRGRGGEARGPRSPRSSGGGSPCTCDIEVVEPEPGHLLPQLVGRIEVAQEARGRLADGVVQRLLEDLRRGLVPSGSSTWLAAFGCAAARRAGPGRAVVRHGGDLGLDLRRQTIAGRRMQLAVEPGRPTPMDSAADIGLVHAPGDAVDQRQIGWAERSGQRTGVPGKPTPRRRAGGTARPVNVRMRGTG